MRIFMVAERVLGGFTPRADSVRIFVESLLQRLGAAILACTGL
jgi:hypothetical protein